MCYSGKTVQFEKKRQKIWVYADKTNFQLISCDFSKDKKEKNLLWNDYKRVCAQDTKLYKTT